jgi:hypothetical protein
MPKKMHQPQKNLLRAAEGQKQLNSLVTRVLDHDELDNTLVYLRLVIKDP